jgi:glycosyltransferase involved in cell wall biosynthesis
MSKVTVITATVGNPLLEKTIRSVANQSHKDVQHLLVVDGPEHWEKVGDIMHQLSVHEDVNLSHVNVIAMPYSIGKDRWNGHRIYAAGAFQAEGQFIIYLDDDNSLEPNHIEECLKVIDKGNDWAYSFRNIVDKDHKFICRDDCESLGKWASVLGPSDFFIDVNCYFIPTMIAIHLGPAWYRKFREPGKPEVDRVLAHTLMNNNLKFDTTYGYTVNYTVGNTQNSVQPEFFANGNRIMRDRYPDGLPWKVQELPL